MNNYKISVEEWNEMIQGLRKFMEDRKLTPEMQRAGFLNNIVEELGEYAVARGQTLPQIDAICDICVFALNTLDGASGESLEVPGYNPSMNLLDLVLKVHTLGNFVGVREMTIRSVKELFYHLVSIGYDPLKCMLETIKEINSRVGYWDENLKKFIKHKGCYDMKHDPVSGVAEFVNSDGEIACIECDVLEDKGTYWVINNNATADGVIILAKWYKAKYAECKL